MKNILILAAHPDDETLGCGGTIHKFSKNADIKVITFTDGGTSREGGTSRISQLHEASKILNFEILDAYAFPDNKLDSIPLIDLNRSVEKTLNSFSFIPDIVMTHNPFCLNVDHKRVFECTQVITRLLHCKTMCFEIPSSSEWNNVGNFRSNCYVKLTSDDLDKKIQALKVAYESELRNYPHPRSIANIVNMMRVNGSVIGEEFAERFMSIKEIL